MDVSIMDVCVCVHWEWAPHWFIIAANELMNCDTIATKSKQWDIDWDGNTSYCCQLRQKGIGRLGVKIKSYLS